MGIKASTLRSIFLVIRSADEIKTLFFDDGISSPLAKQKILLCSRNLPITLFTFMFSENPFIPGLMPHIPLTISFIFTPF